MYADGLDHVHMDFYQFYIKGIPNYSAGTVAIGGPCAAAGMFKREKSEVWEGLE